MASLWVQRISNGCGHCALGVTSVEYMLLHVCNIVCYHVLSGSGSVSVYTSSISPSIVVAFLKVRREFSQYGRCAQRALCFPQCKVRASTLYILVIRVYV